MNFFHLSHTDLDGYGCQLISKKIFSDGNFYNANYGLEVKTNIDIILKIISNIKNKQEDIFFLISDLNLTPDEARSLNRSIINLNNDGFKIKLQLLDHHATGEISANKHEWYYLDTSRCATKIVFDYFCKHYEEFLPSCSDDFITLVEAINDVDIWQDEDKYFEFGKVAMRLISSAYEINPILFPNENRNYRFKLLEDTLQFINQTNSHILLDDNMHFLKKNYLQLSDQNDTLDNLSAKHLVYLLENKKDEFTIYFKEHKGLLTFTLSNISIPANTFLKENPTFDFVINVGRRGSIGIRANGKLDVSILAQQLANGGGHPNASGGCFKNWKETIKYNDVKKFIIEKLEEIS